MATLYLRSTDGSDADNGTTWALAKATLAGIDAIDTAGDTIYVSQVHSESTAGAVTINLAGTTASPTKVICGNDGAEPPSAGASTAVVATGVTSSALQINSTGVVFFEGIVFKAGVSAVSSGAALVMQNSSGVARYHNCEFWTSSSGGTAYAYVGSTSTSVSIWQECQWKPATTTHVLLTVGVFRWLGGSIPSGSAAVTTIVVTDGRSEVYIEGVDLSNADTGVALCTSARPADVITFHKCKLPSGWNGVLNSGTTDAGAIIQLINCDAGAVNYAYWLERQHGSLRHETTIVRTGGATDGVTQISWKIVTTANSTWQFPFMALPMTIWSDTTAANVTVTVYGIWGGGAVPNNDEIWIEVSYLGSSATPQATINTANTKTNGIVAATAQSSDGSTWGGSTTAFKMAVTLSSPQPGMKGLIYVTVKVAKASSTFYVDPKIVLT